MHFSTVKIPIDYGLGNKLSASISFLILKAIFLTYLHCFICTVFISHLTRPPFVNISETIVGYGSNRSPLFIELTFCCKSLMNILIENGYCNQFIHPGRPILPVNHNSLCLK